MNRRNAILLLGIVAVICVIAIVAAAETEDRGTRAGETYVGDPDSNCGCHPDNVANWSETQHADPDDDFQDKHGTNVYQEPYCGPCHVLGYDESIGGFNSTDDWNSTENMKYWTVQCENCHGPASDHNGDPAGINVDRDPYTACFGYGNADCHAGLRQFGYETGIPGWNQSVHAPFENDPTEDHGLNTYCAECKSPSQYDPTAEYGQGEDIDIEDWRGITCADCHNPHNVTPYPHQLKWSPKEACDECHQEERHQSIRTGDIEGEPSVEIEEYSYMDEVECVDCHMYTTEREIPEQWKVIGHSFKATIEACVWCHSDVYEDLPENETTGEVIEYDEGDPASVAAWEAWNETLQEALEEWGSVVDGQKERYETQLTMVEDLYEEAERLKDIAEGNDTWTEDMDDIFDQAEYDFGLAEHNNEGTHNPYYTTALFEAAGHGFEEIIEELSMGTLKGWVTDEDNVAVEDAYIVADGKGTTTDSNGMYMVILEPGTYDVSAFIQGKTESEVEDLEVKEAIITVQNFTLAPDFDRDGTADETDTDDDNDGIPDDYESANGMDPMDATDADDDDDGDGLTNLQEYKDQTDPQDSADFIKTGAGDEEEADNMIYIIIIVVLIVVIIIVALMGARKGGGAPSPPKEEPMVEEPMDEEMPEEEEEL